MAKRPRKPNIPPATKSSISSGDRLTLDAVEALRGADNLRDRLLAALQSGTPAVADVAYAVKFRVKEDYKLVDKVLDRRRGSGDRVANPDYQVSDVTDIVGVRIITLYRLDALEVIEALLTAMGRDRSASAAFVADSTSEIIIYTANPDGDVQKLPKLLRALFDDHGLGGVTKPASRPSNYSSIHILARGRGKYRDGYREIPIEIQVRTALEDVWGEIEHELKYKRKRISITEDGTEAGRRLTTTLDHLGALKTMVDGLGQYADQIKVQIDELEPDLRYSTSKSAEDPNARLNAMRDLDPETRARIAGVIAEARPALDDTKLPSARRVAILRSALSHLEEEADRIPTIEGISPRSRNELRYVISMQRALAHFQIGNLIESGDRQLGRALAIYREVEQAHSGRPIVAYRIARTLDALGAREDAIAKMRDVVQRLDEPGAAPASHWIRAAAPRGLAVLLWETLDRGPADPKKPADAQTISVLDEAIALTRRAYAAEVIDDPMSGSTTSERARSANNLLYFLLERRDAEEVPATIPIADDDEVRTLTDEVAGAGVEDVASLSTADTLRRAYAYLGQRDREAAAAHRVIALAKTPTTRSAIVREAIRQAEKVLEGGGAGVSAQARPDAPT